MHANTAREEFKNISNFVLLLLYYKYLFTHKGINAYIDGLV